MPIPRATARLQFHRDFTLDDGASVVDYYASLGISHFYASPIFTARRGSTHGYDIVDPTAINPELGGEAALRRLVTRLRAAGMGLIIDIVPNHMGVAGSENPWWQDVLEWGQASPHATWFDIDWEREEGRLHGKVLLPFLGQQYGDVLASGDLGLHFDAERGKIFVGYHAHRFPIAPADYPAILEASASAALDAAIGAFRQLTDNDAVSVRDHAGTGFSLLREAVRNPAALQAIEAAIARFSPTEASTRAALHALLERQNYRLSWWRYAADGINWRRFFEVTDLAGMRVEHDEVFEATHALVFRLYEEGLIDGVRVDHVDGLADPRGYCRKLRSRLEALAAKRPDHLPDGPAYIVVEKILASDELLRADWRVDGTTGYEFMDQVGALLHHPAGAPQLDALWTELTGKTADFDTEVHAARRQLMTHNLAAEFNAAIRAVLAVANADLATRDFSHNAIRRVYAELLVFFPVYRTYVTDEGRDPHDRAVFEQALARAREQVYSTDLPLLERLDAWLGGVGPASIDDEATRHLLRTAIRRFQQLTPPMAAKSVEDTAFYRYGRLLSRNEVGADPGHFSLSVRDFHHACMQRARCYPNTMLATATHDHKRGEDVTARMAVLSELPREWAQRVRRWMSINAPLRELTSSADTSQPDTMPDAADEIMLYQMLVGAWPIGLEKADRDGILAFADRIAQWQKKALREAKVISNWIEPNERYEAACRNFLDRILDDRPDNVFLDELLEWVRRITPPGVINGLTQTVLRLTSPGVPDLYQGTEFWDFSLVDPDNRRPVDYAARRQALGSMSSLPLAGTPWSTGALKQQIIRTLLEYRRSHSALFAVGDYQPLMVAGAKASKVIAFLRQQGNEALVVVATRFAARNDLHADLPLIAAVDWEDTVVLLPPARMETTSWTELLCGECCVTTGGRLPVADALRQLSVAVLVLEA